MLSFPYAANGKIKDSNPIYLTGDYILVNNDVNDLDIDDA